MALELSRLPTTVPIPVGLTVRRVRTAADLEEVVEVLGADSPSPDLTLHRFYERAASVLLAQDCPMRLFLGTLDGEPVATSELFLGGGVAGLYGVATRAEFRRRGIGTALCWTALDEARRLGLGTAVLQASEVGAGVYARLGFRACCRFVEYR
jgi:GNAT superfamily N-acetyltransferase